MQAIFAAYVTGAAGTTVVFLYFGNGEIVGVDAGGVRYEGRFEATVSGGFACQIAYKIPTDTQLITGNSLSVSGQTLAIKLDLPERFWHLDFVRAETPTGIVNIRFELIKELG